MNYTFRHGRNNTLVSASVYPTKYPEFDEQYDLIVCQYTKALVLRKDAIVLGPVIPQSPCSYLCHPLATESRKESVNIFQSHEKNCNTCMHLERVAFDRKYWSKTGLMPGKCNNENRNPLYPRDRNNILFAPDDCMLQECYEQRKK